MDLKLIKEKDYPLLSRKRVTFTGEASGATPSRLELKDNVAKLLKKKPEEVVIRHVYTKFGNKNIKIIAHAYNSEKELLDVEDKTVIKKNTPPKAEGEA
jgi:small subunit ribosomal protein S24e